MKISVIIPALNEEEQIDKTLQKVREQPGPHEVVVVDGGSSDETALRASRYGRVLRAPRGRARQMNRGAAGSSGEVLLFLHADTRLPPHGLARIRAALSDPEAEAGAFRLRFDDDAPLLRLYAFCTRLSLPQMCFGDRGLFIRRSTFEAVGGFPEVPIFEDLEMVLKLYRRGGFRFLPQEVTTSARRFLQNGAARQQLRNALLWTSYMLGTSPEELAAHYSYEPD